MRRHVHRTTTVALTLAAGLHLASGQAVPASTFPPPPLDQARTSERATAVLAGGCFWGMEGVFEHVRGVTEVVSGYAGGTSDSASYDQVSTGDTGHAEAVRIRYDPARVSYGQLLEVFFAVAHDPTQSNRQGPDVGPQYRSAIFYADAAQRRSAERYIAALDAAHRFARPLATQVTPLGHFYPAEPYHQDYLARHPDQPYIRINDLPKLDALRQSLPELYVAHQP